MNRTLTQRQQALATIIVFRARVEQVTPAEAVELIAAHYRGDWQRWALGGPR